MQYAKILTQSDKDDEGVVIECSCLFPGIVYQSVLYLASELTKS
jgi:hypothetical protein